MAGVLGSQVVGDGIGEVPVGDKVGVLVALQIEVMPV